MFSLYKEVYLHSEHIRLETFLFNFILKCSGHLMKCGFFIALKG